MSGHQQATIEDTVYFWFGANDTSGSGGDGASPVFDVREAGEAAGDAPLLSGTATLLSHGDYPAGCHEVAVAATTGNGFAAGDTFAVFCTILVDSQNPTGFVGSCTLTPLATTAELNKVPKSDGTSSWNATALTAIEGEVNDALVALNLDHLLKEVTVAADMTAEVVDNTIMSRILSNGDTSAFVPSTDGLQLIRDRGDAEWITATGFSVAGDAMNLAADAIKAVSYDESTAFPLKANDAGATQVARVGADGDTLETISDQIDDVPTVAEFEARTIVAADYLVEGDTLARVTLTDTVTANSDLVSAADVKTAMEAPGGDLSNLAEGLINKRIWRESDGRLEMFDDSNVSKGTIAAQVDTDGTFTTAKQAVLP